MTSRIKITGIILITLALIISCKTQNFDKPHVNNDPQNDTKCPEDGICKLSIIPNQSIAFKRDEFENGYVEFTNADTLLLKFEYQREELPNTVDAHYIERIYLQLPSNPKTWPTEHQDLTKVNLLFERLCYCKGQTGFYKIEQGSLSIKPLENHKYHLKLNFNIDEVQQVLTEIDQIFTWKQ